MSIIVVISGVMFGVLAASFIMMSLVMNKKVLRWYTNKISAITAEMIQEQLNNIHD